MNSRIYTQDTTLGYSQLQNHMMPSMGLQNLLIEITGIATRQHSKTEARLAQQPTVIVAAKTATTSSQPSEGQVERMAKAQANA